MTCNATAAALAACVCFVVHFRAAISSYFTAVPDGHEVEPPLDPAGVQGVARELSAARSAMQQLLLRLLGIGHEVGPPQDPDGHGAVRVTDVRQLVICNAGRRAGESTKYD
jgi:hypothetical protein